MFSAPSGIFMVTCLYVDAQDRETWLEAGETGRSRDMTELVPPHAVIWNADRRIFFGNPSFEVASEADLQDVPGYMDMLFTKHGLLIPESGRPPDIMPQSELKGGLVQAHY